VYLCRLALALLQILLLVPVMLPQLVYVPHKLLQVAPALLLLLASVVLPLLVPHRSLLPAAPLLLCAWTLLLSALYHRSLPVSQVRPRALDIAHGMCTRGNTRIRPSWLPESSDLVSPFPKTYRDALQLASCHDRGVHSFFQVNNTWDFFPRPKDVNVADNWLYCHKYHLDGSLDPLGTLCFYSTVWFYFGETLNSGEASYRLHHSLHWSVS
jgi:hypothetical protein